MTAADADARFAALVAEHRAEKKSRTSREVFGKSGDALSALAAPLCYCLGVAAGTIWHVKPLTAVLVGLPLLFIVRGLLKRWHNRLGTA